MKIKVGQIVEVSLIDVLNNPSFVIWFSGCNFRCPWCFNKKIVLGFGKEIEIDEIIKKIEKVKYAIEYVQATGGEPTLQKEGLKELFRKVKEIGLKTSLDTNCSRPEVIEELVKLNLIDHLATDLKTDLVNEKYWKVIGVKIEGIVEKFTKCLELIKGKVKFIEIRSTYGHGLVNKEDIVNGLKKVKEIIGDDFFFVLQQFYPEGDLIDESFKKIKIIPHETLVSIAKEIKREVKLKKVFVRSIERVEKIE